jgi:2-polyprenyl-3-methyl-5-hydroxy-6-metoxy-1,4-benzoquinol methylase
VDENEEQIIDSWNKNALSWTRVIREKQIESRVLVTEKAILETVIELNPITFLDVGCGEGWLCRELFSKGIDGWGVDASADLIEAARHELTPLLISLRQRDTQVILALKYLYTPIFCRLDSVM